MVDAPEKIWAVFGNHGLLAFRDDRPHSVEYTRSDLVAELEAENERLMIEAFDAATAHGKTKVERNNAKRRAEQAEVTISDLRSVIDLLEAEALSRTGAVKVKAARAALRELAATPMNLSLDDWDRISNAILSALEPATPEGQQPVAWRARHSEQENWYLHTEPVGWWECQPLYTRPSEQAVTEAMAVCPECDGQKLMHGYDCDCPRCEATGVVPLGTAIRSILDDDDADVFEKLDDIRRALGRKA